MLTPVPPTDCMRAREGASARLDGALGELERARLDAHLAACVDCREFAAEAGTATALLRDAALERPPAGLWAEPAPARRRMRGILGATAAAAALVAAAAAPSFLLGRTLGHQPVTSTATGVSAYEPSRSPVDPALIAMLRGQQSQGGRIIHV